MQSVYSPSLYVFDKDGTMLASPNRLYRIVRIALSDHEGSGQVLFSCLTNDVEAFMPLAEFFNVMDVIHPLLALRYEGSGDHSYDGPDINVGTICRVVHQTHYSFTISIPSSTGEGFQTLQVPYRNTIDGSYVMDYYSVVYLYPRST